MSELDTTRPGGFYIGADGRPVDAGGKLIEAEADTPLVDDEASEADAAPEPGAETVEPGAESGDTAQAETEKPARKPRGK
ncbi:MAG TPA: hypothetical protein PLC98_15820 [Anaerolineales bacterium]|nr:hypothetical protein [Anaerolineales bacterium]